MNMLTENEIQVLPDFIANQIAAGEVVQRPESVIKELVENAIDAGADSIFVVVRGAGKQLVHVGDNGKGMSKTDLLLAPKRHATSKIKTSEDLQRIMTLGFRGEALASIASVANLEIRTRRESDETGWRFLSAPLAEESVEPFKVEKGTQIFVKNLFFNVPARRKFLRSDLTEFRHISDTMLKFALGNPHIRFVFYDDDSLVFDVKPADMRTRIADILGQKFADSLLPINFQTELVKVRGFIGQPHFAKQNKNEAFLYLNGRSIVSRHLQHAIISAYEHLIDKYSYPPYIVFLEIDPEKVDVNVHPQKHEVKFDDDRTIYNAIHQAAVEAVSSFDITPEVRFREQAASGTSPFEKIQFNEPGKPSNTALVNRLTGEIIEPQRRQTDVSPTKNTLSPTIQQTSAFGRESLFGGGGKNWDKTDISGFSALFGDEKTPEISQETAKPEGAQKVVMYAQLYNKYILSQSDKGLVIIDQHVAHERILYERALKAMNEAFPYSQELLFSVAVHLNTSDLALVKELWNNLHSLGYDLAFTASGSVEIRGVPLDVKSGVEEDSLHELLAQYREYEEIRHTDARDNLAASFACKAAIKAGDPLSPAEMRKLTEDLYATKMPYVCPHGRPVVVEFPLDELDRRFGRTS